MHASLWIVFTAVAAAQQGPTSATGFTANDGTLASRVRAPLLPVSADGKLILAYELELTNVSSQDVSLVRLEASGDGSSKPSLIYGPNELAQNTKQIAPPAAKAVKVLKPGSRTVVFCWIEFGPAEPLPRGLQHQIFYRLEKASEKVPVRSIRDPPVAVGPVSNLVIGPPLGAGDWWAALGPSNSSEHRRAQVRIAGNANPPFAQRFAIDWVELCAGRFYTNHGSSNSDFCGYGKDVLAVADARVAAMKDGIPDNQPGEGSRAVKITLETLLGNHVVLDLGNHLFVVYAHLQPGSLQVKAGGLVQRGQTIGRLGNSGNSDAPHLHLHVAQAEAADQVESAQSEPFPYVFDRFEVVGSYSRRGAVKQLDRQIRARELPLDGQVVRFPPSK